MQIYAGCEREEEDKLREWQGCRRIGGRRGGKGDARIIWGWGAQTSQARNERRGGDGQSSISRCAESGPPSWRAGRRPLPALPGRGR